METQQRLVFRCVTEYLIGETSRLSRRHGGDFSRAAVFLAIAQGSRTLPGDRDDPSKPQRPISIRSVSTSLALPFETTRRKVGSLEAAGLCRRIDDIGFIATSEGFLGEAFERDCALTRRSLATLLTELAALGAEPGRTSGAVRGEHCHSESEVAAIVAAHTGASILRMLEFGVTIYGSMVNTVLFAAMIMRNAGVVTHDPELARRYAGATTPPPDALRRPVTVAELSDLLGFSYDVVHRRIREYVDRGQVSRVRGGYMFSMEVQQTPEVLHSGLLVVQRFYQMLRTLRDMGIDPAVVPDAQSAMASDGSI